MFTCVNAPLTRDSKLSVTHRKKGNDFYKDKRLHDALEEYNKVHSQKYHTDVS